MEDQVNLLGSILTADNVALDLDAKDRDAIFDAVAAMWQANNGLDAAEVAAGLRMREEIGSTGLGHGLAIPHARVRHLSGALAAFVRLKQPIDYDAPDNLPVGDFFVLVVPADATELHLEILAQVAEKMSVVGFRGELREAGTSVEVVRLFAG